MASLQINNPTIQSIAERIVQARRLYGADSSYVIGLFQGLDLLLAGSDADSVRQQLQDQVVKLEGAAPRPAASGGAQQRPDSRRAPAATESTASPTAADDALAENTWIRGAVKWFNNDKGYGFISTAADADVFVHWRDISSWDRSLTQGDEVEFMVTKTAKGFQAINVMKPGSGDDKSDEETATEEARAAQAPAEAAAEEVGSVDGVVEPNPADEQPAAAEPAPAEAGPAVAAADEATTEPTTEPTTTEPTAAPSKETSA